MWRYATPTTKRSPTPSKNVVDLRRCKCLDTHAPSQQRHAVDTSKCVLYDRSKRWISRDVLRLETISGRDNRFHNGSSSMIGGQRSLHAEHLNLAPHFSVGLSYLSIQEMAVHDQSSSQKEMSTNSLPKGATSLRRLIQS